MTRREARMVAEELYNLMRSDIIGVAREQSVKAGDEYLTTEQAAQMLGMTAASLQHRSARFPHVRVGRRNLYSRAAIAQLLTS